MNIIFDINPSQKPCCDVPGCNKNAQNTRTTVDPYYRKASWVAEQFGEGSYVCGKHHSQRYLIGDWAYKIHRKDYCENVDGRLGFKCTTTIVDPEWQLDGDHINGDPSDNRKENIQTLCKCCHAMKTKMEKDYLSPGRKTLGVA
jgi:hypothetical protein